MYRYEGATEAAVLRCARLALGLPLQGNAHLVWKSGDIVDFDKPITDGVTLYLETTIAPYNDYYYGGGSIGSGNSRGSSSGGGGAIGGLYSGAGDGLAQRRSSAGDQIRRWRSGADDGGHRAWGSVVDRRTGSPPPTVALGGFIHRLFRFSRGKDNSDRERNSDDERRPLLYARSSSAQKLHQEQKAYRTLLVGQAGGSPGSLRGINGAANETCDPEEQRQSLLKLKRILAHLANERTLLAWVRVMGKLFTAGTLSMTLAAESHGGYTVSFFVLGMVYFAMCPYVVFVGSSRLDRGRRREFAESAPTPTIIPTSKCLYNSVTHCRCESLVHRCTYYVVDICKVMNICCVRVCGFLSRSLQCIVSRKDHCHCLPPSVLSLVGKMF